MRSKSQWTLIIIHYCRVASPDSSKYKTYFRKCLLDAGYNSPADIPEDKKHGFFLQVDQGWTSKELAGTATEVCDE